MRPAGVRAQARSQWRRTFNLKLLGLLYGPGKADSEARWAQAARLSRCQSDSDRRVCQCASSNLKLRAACDKACNVNHNLNYHRIGVDESKRGALRKNSFFMQNHKLETREGPLF